MNKLTQNIFIVFSFLIILAIVFQNSSIEKSDHIIKALDYLNKKIKLNKIAPNNHNLDTKYDKYIVITTINNPTKQVEN